jgi:tetratricopeptide (TPR) repeat protein
MPLPPKDRTYQDFRIDFVSIEGSVAQARITSPVEDEATVEIEFPFLTDETEFLNRMLMFQNALLSAASDVREIPHERAVRSFGREIHSALFQGKVASLFERTRDREKVEGLAGTRIRLRIRPPELVPLPWELLYDIQQDDYVGLSTRTPIVRDLKLPRPVESTQVRGPLRILGMISNPSALNAPLKIHEERENLRKAVRAASGEYPLELGWVPGETFGHLKTALDETGPWHILHFIGHGRVNEETESGELLFDDGLQGVHAVSAKDFSRVLGDCNTLRLAVLNSCLGGRSSEKNRFSSVAASLVRREVPAVLAMQQAISDRAAISFSQHFYGLLCRGYAIDAAVTRARGSLAEAGSIEWVVPVLYFRCRDGILFNVAPPPAPKPAEAEGEARAESPPAEEAATAVRAAGADAPVPARDAPEGTTVERETTGEVRIDSTVLEAEQLSEFLDAEDELNDLAREADLSPDQLNRITEIDRLLYGHSTPPEDLVDLLARAHFSRGDALQEKAATARAIPHYERAIELDPGMDRARMRLGSCLVRERDYQRGIARIREVVDASPDDASNHFLLGIAVQAAILRGSSAGDRELCIQAFDRAIELAPDSYRHRYHRGRAYRLLERPLKALADFDAVLATKPQEPGALCERGLTYLALNEEEKAIADLRTAAGLGSAAARKHLAQVAP